MRSQRSFKLFLPLLIFLLPTGGFARPLHAPSKKNHVVRNYHKILKSVTYNVMPSAIDNETIDPQLRTAMEMAPSATQWPNNDYARVLDIGDITIKPDGTVVGTYREIFKLFNERARRLAEVSIPYNASYQSVKVIQARTIKPDGKIMGLRGSDMRNTSMYNDFPLYDDTMSLGFSMPGVEDGCLIDYTFQEITRPVLMPGEFWQYWTFDGTDPVMLSRFTVHIPVSKAIHYQVFNDPNLHPKITLSSSGRIKNYVFEERNLKPIVIEPAMPGMNEVKKWLEISSMDTWQQIAAWYWALSKPESVPDDSLRSVVNQLIAGKRSEPEKAAAIYAFVADKVRYVGLEFGLSAFRPHSATEVLQNLYGDCKDKATLLITMLNVAGIRAWPALLESGDSSLIHNQLPTLSSFNHCIAVAFVDNSEVWLDATSASCAYGDIPVNDRGAEAMVIREGVGQFEMIPEYSPEQSGLDSVVNVQLNVDGGAKIETSATMLGAESQQWRETARNLTPDQRWQLMQQWAQSVSTGATLQKWNLPDGSAVNGNFSIQMSLSAPHLAKTTVHFMLIPAAIGLNDSNAQNPFVQDTRVWPIVVNNPMKEHSETTINLPSGYEIEELPPDVSLSTSLFEYRRKTVESPDKRTLVISVTSISKNGVIPPALYTQVKEYYNAILHANGDLIIMKKTG